MYLSRIQLDPRRRSTMKALASPNLLHGAVEQSFSGPRERNLWRIDKLGNCIYLLVLSRELPDFNHVTAQFGLENNVGIWETKNYDTLLNRIESGSTWHFRLTANPTVSKTACMGKRGKVLGHITEEYQKRWLLDRAEKHGFSLSSEVFSVVQSRWLRFWKGAVSGKPVALLSVTYEGLLTVTDTELFCHTLTEGLGRGKAYGLGLLTVARPQS